MKLIIYLILVITILGCGDPDHLPDAYGNFEAVEIIVFSESAGRLMEFQAEEGRRLEAGSPVATVDTTQLHLKRRQLLAQQEATRSRLEGVRALVAVNREQHDVAAIEQARLHRLVGQEGATQKQLDDVEGQMRVLQRQIQAIHTQETTIRREVDVLQVQLEQVQDEVDRAQVTNPVAGTVLTRYAEVYELVSPGRPLYKLADLETMYLRVYVSGSQLSGIRIGQSADVFVDDAEGSLKQYSGEVSWISEQAEFTPRTVQTRDDRVTMVYAVKIRVPNDGTLKIGTPGEARF